MFITLWLLTSALLRPLPIGESENAPLPFSAASTLSHGIASPLPAVSESGKVKPRPLALPNVPATPPPVHHPVTMSVFVYLWVGCQFNFSQGQLSSSCDACSVGLCAHEISFTSFCCVLSAVAVVFFFVPKNFEREQHCDFADWVDGNELEPFTCIIRLNQDKAFPSFYYGGTLILSLTQCISFLCQIMVVETCFFFL